MSLIRNPLAHAPALLLVILVAACSSPAPKTAARPSPSPTPSPSPSPAGPPLPTDVPAPVPIAGALPGQTLPVSDLIKSPLLIQVENTAPSRPQAGLAAASVIFQSLAESDITRLTVLFHRVPGIVGPVRSARFVTVYLAQHLDGTVMASGGSPSTLDRLVAAHVPTYVNDYDGGRHFFRWGGRAAPHNVYTTQSMMLDAIANSPLPNAKTDVARSRTWSGTEPAPAINVEAHRTSFNFNGSTYDIVTEGAPLTDVEFGAVQPVSVAVLHVKQWEVPGIVDVAGTPVKDYDLRAGGAAEFYAKGTVIHGSWATAGDLAPITFQDAAGQPVGMPPGLLWVSLPP